MKVRGKQRIMQAHEPQEVPKTAAQRLVWQEHKGRTCLHTESRIHRGEPGKRLYPPPHRPIQGRALCKVRHPPGAPVPHAATRYQRPPPRRPPATFATTGGAFCCASALRFRAESGPDLAESEPMLAGSRTLLVDPGPHLVESGRLRPHIGRNRPNFGRARVPNLGRVRPNSTEFDRRRPHFRRIRRGFGSIWASSNGFGPISANSAAFQEAACPSLRNSTWPKCRVSHVC